MSYHLPEDRLEDCFADAIEAALPDSEFSIAKGFETDSVVYPVLIIAVTDSDPEVAGDTLTGNWTCSLTLTLKTQYSDTSRAEHSEMMASVRDFVFHSDLLSLLNAQANNLTIHLVTPEKFNRATDGQNHVSAQSVSVYLSPSVLHESSSSSSP